MGSEMCIRDSFEQVQNGVYVRMALIMTLLGLRDPKAPKEEN